VLKCDVPKTVPVLLFGWASSAVHTLGFEYYKRRSVLLLCHGVHWSHNLGLQAQHRQAGMASGVMHSPLHPWCRQSHPGKRRLRTHGSSQGQGLWQVSNEVCTVLCTHTTANGTCCRTHPASAHDVVRDPGTQTSSSLQKASSIRTFKWGRGRC
jgi:hypothetical protein